MKRSTGVLLAVLAAGVLLGVCVIGIVAAIAIPTFLGAREKAKERGKQARAMEDMRKIASACEGYASKKHAYPPAGSAGQGFDIIDAHVLMPFLTFSCMDCNFTDPWNNSYGYGTTRNRGEFVLVCTGSDGKLDLDSIPDQQVSTHCFEDDIIWRNGGFIQQPEGAQKTCR